MSKNRIPVASTDLDGFEREYALEAIDSSWISSTGKFVERFEKTFSQKCSVDNVIPTCNGTIALHLALLTLDLRPGDEVLVPSLTFIATASAVRYVGAEPVFVDVDKNNWCMDPEKIEDAITRRTKGIIAVHLYGHPADMDRINSIAAVHGLWVVEDAAEAHFATYKGKPVGGLADIGTFSFFGNKIITCGEGGAITLNNKQLSIRARSLWGQGMDPHRKYYFPIVGHNFRLSNVACAILCAQIERSDKLLERRRKIFSIYDKHLRGAKGLGFQPVSEWANPAPWLYCITIDDDACEGGRDGMIEKLADKGIDTRPFFIPLHTLPPFREKSRERGEILPQTDLLGGTGLNLPTYSKMNDEQPEFVCEEIKKILNI